jgi:hypothetical protein
MCVTTTKGWKHMGHVFAAWILWVVQNEIIATIFKEVNTSKFNKLPGV